MLSPLDGVRAWGRPDGLDLEEDAGAIKPRNTGIFPAAWLESLLEETAVMGGERGRLGEGGNRSAEAAKRSEKASPPLRKHWRKS